MPLMSSCKNHAHETKSGYLIILPPTLLSYFWGKDTASGSVIGKGYLFCTVLSFTFGQLYPIFQESTYTFIHLY